jgi:hypothetical protein
MAEPLKEAKAMKKQRAFTAPHEVYTGGLLYEPGQVFVTDEPKGREWQPASEAEALAAEAKAEAAAATDPIR